MFLIQTESTSSIAHALYNNSTDIEDTTDGVVEICLPLKASSQLRRQCTIDDYHGDSSINNPLVFERKSAPLATWLLKCVHEACVQQVPIKMAAVECGVSATIFIPRRFLKANFLKMPLRCPQQPAFPIPISNGKARVETILIVN